jgi:mRNA interferase RelE/StbE
MTYKLILKKEAVKEWNSLTPTIKQQFKKKLTERLECPHVPSAKLRGMANFYKIKLRNIGYRLVYEVRDQEVVVVIVAVGKRDKNIVYKKAMERC